MIDTYNYLATTFYNRPATKNNNTSHDKKELKNVYNSIVKMNRESPLYMFNLSDDNQEFAVNVKESAYNLSSLLDEFTSDSDIFDKTVFSSSDSDSVAISVDNKSNASSLSDFFIKVDGLATKQANEGRHVYPESSGLSPGRYSFNITVFDDIYSFQFPVSSGMNNKDIQDSLTDFINQSNIGLNTYVAGDIEENKTFIKLENEFTGSGSNDKPSFYFEDITTVNGRGIAEYFDLNNITQEGKNAHFNIDGVDRTTHSNTFTYNNSITISLLQETDDPVLITKTSDPDVMLNTLERFTNSYNNLIDTAISGQSGGNESYKLINSVSSASSKFRSSLEACGVNIGSDGKLTIDKSLAYQAVDDGDLLELLSDKNGVIGNIKNKVDGISLNPMEFIKKTIVTYPNISKPATSNPYVTSIYSGMLFNYYC